MKPLLSWLRQPTSVAGASAFIGAISAIVTHQLTWVQAAPLLCGAVISIILPDNTVAKGDAIALSEALIAKLHNGAVDRETTDQETGR